MFNFKAVAAVLLANKAAIQIKDGSQLPETIRHLLKDKNVAASLGNNARKTRTTGRDPIRANKEPRVCRLLD
jgi:3-deoxy-D-manno-octulosonic-acid transferase